MKENEGAQAERDVISNTDHERGSVYLELSLNPRRDRRSSLPSVVESIVVGGTSESYLNAEMACVSMGMGWKALPLAAAGPCSYCTPRNGNRRCWQ